MRAEIEFNLDNFLEERDRLIQTARDYQQSQSRVSELNETLFNTYARLYKVPKKDIVARRAIFFGYSSALYSCHAYKESAFKVTIKQESKRR